MSWLDMLCYGVAVVIGLFGVISMVDIISNAGNIRTGETDKNANTCSQSDEEEDDV